MPTPLTAIITATVQNTPGWRGARFVLEARGIRAVEAALALAAAQALVGLSIREVAAQTLRQLAQQ